MVKNSANNLVLIGVIFLVLAVALVVFMQPAEDTAFIDTTVFDDEGNTLPDNSIDAIQDNNQTIDETGVVDENLSVNLQCLEDDCICSDDSGTRSWCCSCGGCNEDNVGTKLCEDLTPNMELITITPQKPKV